METSTSTSTSASTSISTSTSTSSESISTNISASNCIITEKNIIGTVVTVNRLKHYAFIKRNDNDLHQDIFARDVSIKKNQHKQTFFISDQCKFDIKKTSRGFEAINITIIQRNIDSIGRLKKISKKKTNDHQPKKDSYALFQSTM
ncbi:unnamed protein product [Rotaria sp. Silwood1]|nr:unnamed protein product [Rotaria sp. Silwood1]CAF1552660.1 unnamed protein product [Rotaria sp. Silwood1]CAF3662794.1 unnamed protein product [Rotaria sp. Silwood1]CAF3773576.1 unnamed protein product [Rotaria sp. Silwood1]